MTALRTGVGFDLHRLVPGRRCVLGGVEVPHDKGPVGHSDGDALLHAVADAILGAAGLDDLGTLFPDTDPKWRGAPSDRLLADATARVRRAGFEIENVDAVVVAESPRLAPHRERIRERLGEILGLPRDRVNVKGKTAEGLGPLGAGEAIAAFATALLRRARAPVPRQAPGSGSAAARRRSIQARRASSTQRESRVPSITRSSTRK